MPAKTVQIAIPLLLMAVFCLIKTEYAEAQEDPVMRLPSSIRATNDGSSGGDGYYDPLQGRTVNKIRMIRDLRRKDSPPTQQPQYQAPSSQPPISPPPATPYVSKPPAPKAVPSISRPPAPSISKPAVKPVPSAAPRVYSSAPKPQVVPAGRANTPSGLKAVQPGGLPKPGIARAPSPSRAAPVPTATAKRMPKTSEASTIARRNKPSLPPIPSINNIPSPGRIAKAPPKTPSIKPRTPVARPPSSPSIAQAPNIAAAPPPAPRTAPASLPMPKIAAIPKPAAAPAPIKPRISTPPSALPPVAKSSPITMPKPAPIFAPPLPDKKPAVAPAIKPKALTAASKGHKHAAHSGAPRTPPSRPLPAVTPEVAQPEGTLISMIDQPQQDKPAASSGLTPRTDSLTNDFADTGMSLLASKQDEQQEIIDSLSKKLDAQNQLIAGMGSGLPSQGGMTPPPTQTSFDPSDDYISELLEDMISNPSTYVLYSGYLPDAGPVPLRFAAYQQKFNRRDLIPLSTPYSEDYGADQGLLEHPVLNTNIKSYNEEIVEPIPYSLIKELSASEIAQMLGDSAPAINEVQVQFTLPYTEEPETFTAPGSFSE